MSNNIFSVAYQDSNVKSEIIDGEEYEVIVICDKYDEEESLDDIKSEVANDDVSNFRDLFYVDIPLRSFSFNWSMYKLQGRDVAKLYEVVDMKKSARVYNCATYLEFIECTENETHRHVVRGNFCEDRFCPICAHRRSTVLALQTKHMLEKYLQQNNNCSLVFLTLTQKNVSHLSLKQEIDNVLNAWTKLTKKKEFRAKIREWTRVLEITVNNDTKELHPHVHAILVVNSNYFSDVIKQYQWVAMWRECLGIDYNPVVYVQRVIARGKSANVSVGASVSAVVSKYISKYMSKSVFELLLSNDGVDTKQYFKSLVDGLRGRRLITYSRGLSSLLHDVKLETDQQAKEFIESVKQDEIYCINCGARAVYSIYKYDNENEKYILVRSKINGNLQAPDAPSP